MVAALSSLEERTMIHNEESPAILYEQLFIDPSKLTPFQHRQLEYQK